MIRLTVITPHYNMVRTLRRLIDSVPKRDWIEHIIVDDKSDDGAALAEVKSYAAAAGARWIDNLTEQKGTGVCRDIGIREAKGGWIMIADADDYFTDGAFDVIGEYLEDEADIIYFAPTSRKEGSGEKSERHVPYRRLVHEYAVKKNREEELRLRFLSVPDAFKMIRRSMITDHGITSSKKPVSNDVMFSVRCAYHAKKIRAVEEVIYCITESPGTLTTAKNVQRFRTRIDVYIEQCLFLKKHLTRKDFRLIGLSASGLLLQCYREYGKAETVRALGQLLRNRVPVNLLDLQTRRSRYVES